MGYVFLCRKVKDYSSFLFNPNHITKIIIKFV